MIYKFKEIDMKNKQNEEVYFLDKIDIWIIVQKKIDIWIYFWFWGF